MKNTMTEKFIQQFKEILEIEEHEVEMNHAFRDYPEWDSLGYLELIALLDEEYGVAIETEDFRKLITLGDLINEVEKRMNTA
jgi:acyl carrier protein